MGSHANGPAEPDALSRAALDGIRRLVQRLRLSTRAAERAVGISAAQLFVLQKLSEGPVWIITARPNGVPNMGKSLAQWFVLALVISLFAGYLTSHALPPGAHTMAVFRFIATSAFMAYTMGFFIDSIWYSRSWTLTFKLAFDGLIYACVMGGTFGWLWPKAMP